MGLDEKESCSYKTLRIASHSTAAPQQPKDGMHIDALRAARDQCQKS